jgi:autotransporter passenger strand-loop-strand repeat protein
MTGRTATIIVLSSGSRMGIVMADDIQEVLFSASYWPGGSGDSGAGIWFIGYDYDYTTDQYLNLVSGAAGSAVIFGGPLPSPYQTQQVDVGGTLTGVLACGSFSLQGGAAYVLLGTLSAQYGDIEAGTQLTVGPGGSLSVSGGTLVGITVSSGGVVGVDDGGSASGTTVSLGGILYLSGGSAGGTILNGDGATGDEGALDYVQNGGTAISTTIGFQGQQNVQAGGTARATEVNSSGSENVDGGTATSTIVNQGGTQSVLSAGATVSTIVSSGGAQKVARGTALETMVYSGGIEYVYSSGTANSTVVSGGGTATVFSGGSASGTIVNSGGLLDLGSGSTGNGAIIFGSPGGTLEVDGSVMPTGVISGFALGDTIDLAGVSFASGGSVQLLPNNVLRIVAGGTYDLQLAGSAATFSDNSFRLSADAAGTGTDISPEPGLSINMAYDPNVMALTNATVVESAVTSAVAEFETDFTNPVTLNIDVGWGEVASGTSTYSAGDPISGGGESIRAAAPSEYSYDQIYSALTSGPSPIQQQAVGTLPNPETPGAAFAAAVFANGIADAQALSADSPTFPAGVSNNSVAIDGWIGFGANDPWSFAGSSTPGTEEDFISYAEHEISEVMGRVSYVGGNMAFLSQDGSEVTAQNVYSPMDLFRYAGTGFHDTSQATATVAPGVYPAGYFSIDNGATDLGTWNNDAAAGDLGDWDPPGAPTSNDSFNYAGVDGPSPISPNDLALMNVIGWNTAQPLSAEIITTPFFNAQVTSGNTLYVNPGEAASGTLISTNGTALVEGGTVSYDFVTNGGIEEIMSGTAFVTTVLSGGFQEIQGGIASGTVVSNKGTQLLFNGATGTTISTMVSSGGYEEIEGGIASGTAVNYSGFELVYDDGMTVGTIVNSGGSEQVFGDSDQDGISGTSISTTVNSGGTESMQGGTASSTTVNYSGYLVVGLGTTEKTVVNSGGVEEVEGVAGHSGQSGTSISATVNSRGTEVVDGGTASNTIVNNSGFLEALVGDSVSASVNGGFENVFFQGTAIATTVNAGVVEVQSGGTVSDTILDNGSFENVDDGGTAIATTVDGGFVNVSDSGTAVATTISSGSEDVSSQGTAIGTTVNSGGELVVFSGGTALSTTLAGGDPEYVYSGGSAISTTVDSGSLEGVYFGGAVDETVVESGGAEFVNAGGTASGTVVSSGGYFVVLPGASQNATTGAVVSTGVVLLQPNAEVDDFGSVASDVVVSGGAVEYVLSGGTAISTTLNDGGTEVVYLGATASFTVVSRGGSIDLPDLTFSSGGSAVLSATTDVLAVTEGDVSELLQLSGLYTGEYFQPAQDSSSGTVLTLNAAPRTLAWTGSSSTNFSTASNWRDVTNDVNPALSGPDQTDTVEFLTGGGPIIGTGAVAALTFDSGGAWQLASSAALSVAGAITIGSSNTTDLLIDEGAGLSATGGATAIIANTGSASGSSVDVSGVGSNLSVTGSLIVGDAGAGLLDIGPGGAVFAGVLDLGDAAGGSGVLTMEGSLTITGSLVVGGSGAGELSILNGASVTIGGDLDIGTSSGSSGNVDVENTTGTLIIDGNLNVGLGGGVATMTIGLDTGVQLDNGGINQGKYSKVIAHTGFDPQFENTNGGGLELANGTNTFLAYFNNNDAGQVTQDASGDQSVLQVPTIYASQGSGSFQINSGDSSLTLNADGVSGQTFQFTDNTGTLVIGIDQLQTIDTPSSGTGPFTAEHNPNLGLHLIGGFGGTIASMVLGDTITVDTTAAAHISYPGSGTVVSVIDNAAGTAVGTLAFASAALAAEIAIGSSSTASQLELVACFAEGTRIGTADGWVRVEDLRVGDAVTTVPGRLEVARMAASCEPIVWIGSRNVDCARNPKPETVWPIRVGAGAFGELVPERDLFLSPDHAVFVNDVLVPVKLLVNGGSITQVKRNHVAYYHLELPEHAVILAEGLPVESYLDIGDRANFTGNGTIRLFPDFAARLAPDVALAWETKGAAPLVMSGVGLAAAWQVVMRHATPCRSWSEPVNRSIQHTRVTRGAERSAVPQNEFLAIECQHTKFHTVSNARGFLAERVSPRRWRDDHPSSR